MPKKQNKPFFELDKFYRQYEDQINNAIIWLIQGILFVLTVIVAFVILLATGIFVF